jgi:hypothetical protein
LSPAAAGAASKEECKEVEELWPSLRWGRRPALLLLYCCFTDALLLIYCWFTAALLLLYFWFTESQVSSDVLTEDGNETNWQKHGLRWSKAQQHNWPCCREFPLALALSAIIKQQKVMVQQMNETIHGDVD